MKIMLIDLTSGAPDIIGMRVSTNTKLAFFEDAAIPSTVEPLLIDLRLAGYRVGKARVKLTGNNVVSAMGFVIACALGRLVERNPLTVVTVVSQNTNFLSVTDHFKRMGYFVDLMSGRPPPMSRFKGKATPELDADSRVSYVAKLKGFLSSFSDAPPKPIAETISSK